MGCPAIAAQSLAALHNLKGIRLTVLTYPDRPAGRGGRIAATDVKTMAAKFSLPVLQPENISDPRVVDEIAALKPDLIAITAYGRILPQSILNIPRAGCINLHASLLPAYRGPSPVQAVIAAGEKRTGVTVQFVSRRMDEGDIIYSTPTDILDSETAGDLMKRLSVIGADLLTRAVRDVLSGTAPRKPQDGKKATYCRLLAKEHGRIDWSLPAEKIYNHIRAMNPWPVAFTTLKRKRLRIFTAGIVDRSGEEGLVLDADPREGIIVACSAGALRLGLLQPENRKCLDSAEHVRGRLVSTGDRLGT